MQETAKCERKKAYEAVWARGSEHAFSWRFDRAQHLLSAALVLSNDDSRARTARLLALCNVFLKKPDRASDYLQMAEKCEPNSVLTAVVQIKHLLSCSQDSAAAQDVSKIPRCADFHLSCLQVESTRISSFIKEHFSPKSFIKISTRESIKPLCYLADAP